MNNLDFDEEFWEQDVILDQELSSNLNLHHVKKINEGIEKKKSDKNNVNIIVTKEKQKVKPINDFVLLFVSSLKILIDRFDLTGKEIKILLAVIEKMELGNQISITQTALAKELNEKQPNVSRAFKKFFESGLLIKDNFGNTFVNSQIILKRNLYQEKNENARVYNLSLDKLKELQLSKNY